MLFPALSLLLGIFACSTAVILIKQSQLDPVLLSSFRLLLAAGILAPWFFRAFRRHRAAFGPRGLLRAVVPGVVLAIHFVTWVIGARGTLAVNASLIVNMIPLAMPFWLLLVAGERVTAPELAGTGLGLLGLGVLASEDFRGAGGAGDVMCFGSMLLCALYMALGRKNRDIPALLLYVVPLYAVAGLVCLLLGLPRLLTLGSVPPRELAYVVGLALVPTIVGHSLINRAMKHFRGGVVSVCNLGQFVFAGINAWLVFGEVPRARFWPAAALVVAGAVVTLRGAARLESPAPEV